MAQLTGFKVLDFTNDGGQVVMTVELQPSGEQLRYPVNEDTTIEFLREQVVQEVKRRNKQDTLHASLMQFKDVVISI